MLPLNQRQVITLVDLEENSYVQVSEILEIPIGTVMSRLNRARKQFDSFSAKPKTLFVSKFGFSIKVASWLNCQC